MMEPVPLQDIDRLKADPGIKLMAGTGAAHDLPRHGPEAGRAAVLERQRQEPVQGQARAPGALPGDRHEDDRRRIMRGAATPTGLMVAPGISGFDPALNKRLPYDPAAAKKLLAEAGYPNGFEVGMNCPNDRYVNDAAICQAMAAMLAQIGVKVNLMAETKATYFPKILSPRHLLLSARLDAWFVRCHNAIFALHHVAGPEGAGPVQPRQLSQQARRRAGQRDRLRDRSEEAQRDDRRASRSTATTSAICRCTSRRWPGR